MKGNIFHSSWFHCFLVYNAQFMQHENVPSGLTFSLYVNMLGHSNIQSIKYFVREWTFLPCICFTECILYDEELIDETVY